MPGHVSGGKSPLSSNIAGTAPSITACVLHQQDDAVVYTLLVTTSVMLTSVI
jgi:hypothetical protein